VLVCFHAANERRALLMAYSTRTYPIKYSLRIAIIPPKINIPPISGNRPLLNRSNIPINTAKELAITNPELIICYSSNPIKVQDNKDI
jgi:hypothetical protein